METAQTYQNGGTSKPQPEFQSGYGNGGFATIPNDQTTPQEDGQEQRGDTPGSPGAGSDDAPLDSTEPKKSKKARRRKIKIEYIKDKSKRHITFSKRKGGIMKKVYELSTLTGTQALLLVASETGHVYTFATPKLQPLITKIEGKNLIQACLNAPDNPQEDDEDEIEPTLGEMKNQQMPPQIQHSQHSQQQMHHPTQQQLHQMYNPQQQQQPMNYPPQVMRINVSQNQPSMPNIPNMQNMQNMNQMSIHQYNPRDDL